MKQGLEGHIHPTASFTDSIAGGPIWLGVLAMFGPQVRAGQYLLVGSYSSFSFGKIGAFTSVGSHCNLNAQNHPIDWLSTHGFQWMKFGDEDVRMKDHPVKWVNIGSDVWIGNSVNIISGVNIGDGAIVAAGAVVTKDVQPYEIVGGVPAKHIRWRFPKSTIERLLKVKWWERTLVELRNLPFDDIEMCLKILELGNNDDTSASSIRTKQCRTGF